MGKAQTKGELAKVALKAIRQSYGLSSRDTPKAPRTASFTTRLVTTNDTRIGVGKVQSAHEA
jgi:hypothetical protein